MLTYADRFTLRDMLVSRALGDRNASIPYTVIDDSSENRFETVPQYYTDVAAVACSVAALLQLCCSSVAADAPGSRLYRSTARMYM
jgi:hypothetical protein